MVRVPPETVIIRVRSALPEFLAELEQAGITDLSRNRYYGPEMHERLRRLHISSCMALPSTALHPPGFYVYPEATGTWVGNGEEIRLFCEKFLMPMTSTYAFRGGVPGHRRALCVRAAGIPGP